MTRARNCLRWGVASSPGGADLLEEGALLGRDLGGGLDEHADVGVAAGGALRPTGMPLPRRRKTAPDCVPAGTRISTLPSSVGTSTTAPSAASTNRDRHLAHDDLPSRLKSGCGLHPHHHVQVPRRAAAPARLALPRHAPRSRRPPCRAASTTVNSRSFSTAPAPLHAAHASPTTLPRAAARRAGLADARRSPAATLISPLPPHTAQPRQAAVAALARRCPCTSRTPPRDGNLIVFSHAERRLDERRARACSGGRAPAAFSRSSAAEQVAEQILEELGERSRSLDVEPRRPNARECPTRS